MDQSAFWAALAAAGGSGLTAVISYWSLRKKNLADARSVEIKGELQVVGAATELVEVLREDLKRLHERVRELEDKNKELREEMDDLRKENRELHRDVEEVRTENQQLKWRCDNLEAENKRLKSA